MVNHLHSLSAPESLVGLQVGSYRFTSLLHSGGMGHVYSGVHIHLHRSVALKAARGDTKAAFGFLQRRLLVEARCLAAVDHPNVVTVHDFGVTHDGIAYVAMELLEGSSLDRIIDQRGPLPVPVALQIAREAARGLAAFHMEGVVCADVKPDNLMVVSGPLVGRSLERRAWVKLIDLGAARPIRQASMDAGPEQTLGTSWYMSPEAVLGMALDERADVYSLGILIYEMITGQVPYLSEDDREVMRQHLWEPPPPLSLLTPRVDPGSALEELCADCLSKAPDGRPSSMYELLDRLDEADLQWRRAHPRRPESDDLRGAIAPLRGRRTSSQEKHS